MTQLKKLVETPITKDDIEKIKWLHSGINAINEKGKRIALEKHLKGKESTITEDEFERLTVSKKISVPEPYKRESERYQKLLSESIYSMTHFKELRDAKLGKMLGIPDAPEHIFEFKKEGKSVGFVHVDNAANKVKFIKNKASLPKKFKEALK